jgi:hypothetical protein
MIRAGIQIVGEDSDPMEILEAAFKAPKEDGGYEKPKRWYKIINWDGFDGPAPTSFKVPLP